MFKIIKKVCLFYYEGFRDLTSFGKELWFWVGVKIIFLIILAVIFFPDVLYENFDSDTERADYVGNNLLDIERD
ncbi:MAG: DUF4492 domain-containing protein [Candidatus Gracilibacteria bacterium]|nr:DUF4492 domain-containing protein [Candidatus Gracilibacteria bacterium]